MELRAELSATRALLNSLGFTKANFEKDAERDAIMGAVLAAVDPAGGLGPATDYQGSLASALRIIEQDIVATDPVVRPRSRYVLVFVSDGVAEPRLRSVYPGALALLATAPHADARVRRRRAWLYVCVFYIHC